MVRYQQLISDLKRGNILPLYLFYGEEEFLLQEAVNIIIQQVVDPGSREFTFTTAYCKETPASELVALAETLPFPSAKRLIIAKDIDAYKAAEVKELLAYLENPSPATCLVMVSRQRKYDKKAILSAVEQQGAVTVFYPLVERELPLWIEGWGRSRGMSLKRDAILYLIQVLGTDLQKIINELQKVELYVNDTGAITLPDVQRVVGDFREFTAFDLADAIGRKDSMKAFQMLTRLLQEGEQPVSLLGMIAWNFRRLMRAKVLERNGSRYEDIKKRLGVLWLHSTSFREQMHAFSIPELRETFTVMLAADRKLKSSDMSGRLVLERMILQLCGVVNGDGAGAKARQTRTAPETNRALER